MTAIGLIAINVFRESVRDKVLYNLVFFALLLIGASYLIGQLTAGQDVKIIKDLGLSATSVFGLFIAVFIGIGLVSKEVERKSVYSLLAKPIHRYQMIAGVFRGEIAAREHGKLLDCALSRDSKAARDVLVVHIEACVDFTLENGTWPTGMRG